MKRKIIAAQLYTLREFCKTPKDIAASMKKVKEIGFDVVQVSGIGPIEPQELKKILDGEGLLCCATHEPGKDIVEEPKIILRQTGYRIVAAVDEQGYYHLNNCHTISFKDSSMNLYALATQLNSVEFNTVYSILSMEKGRALAQIDMDFLLQRFVIKTSSKQESTLEKFYFEQQSKYMKNQAIDEYSLEKLLF